MQRKQHRGGGGDTSVQGTRPTLGEKSSTDNSQTGRNGRIRKQADTNSQKNVSYVTRTVGSTLTNSVDSTATSYVVSADPFSVLSTVETSVVSTAASSVESTITNSVGCTIAIPVVSTAAGSVEVDDAHAQLTRSTVQTCNMNEKGMKQQKMLKYFYTNADNKFPEFQARVKASNCMIVGITEAQAPKVFSESS